MLYDLRFAVRMLLKRPGFTALAALTLAVGIGATAAVFSLVEGVLLTPPPYRDPDRLVIIPSVRVDSQQVERIEAHAGHPLDGLAAARDVVRIGRRARAGRSTSASTTRAANRSKGMVVTPEYFRVVGVQPMLGRAFTAEDAKPGQPSTRRSSSATNTGSAASTAIRRSSARRFA